MKYSLLAILLVIVLLGMAISANPFPPTNKVVKAIKNATLHSEKSFENLLSVSPDKVAYVKDGVVVNENSINMQKAQWISNDGFKVPVTISYLHLKKAGGCFMAGYVTRTYAVHIAQMQNDSCYVVDSEPITVASFKGYKKTKSIPSYYDVFQKAERKLR